MIIRSLSRKDPSFRQLFFYMNREKGVPYFVSWNLNLVNHLDYQRVLDQFYENAELLKTRKNGNYLYHEIISIKLSSGVSLDRQMKALHDVSQKYIQARGPNLLSYGRMHIDDKSLHMHVMFSANELNQSNRHRLSREQFATIQRQCEQYLQQTYPDLKQPVLYLKDREQKPNKSRQREYEFTKRTGKKTQKQKVKEQLEELLSQRRTQSLKQLFKEHGFELYQRGKHYGVLFRGTKYRMVTLGLADEFLASKKRGFTPDPATPEPDFKESQDKKSTNQKTNMDKLYEQMKTMAALREYELARRANLSEKILNELLKQNFPEHPFKVYCAGNAVYVQLYGATRLLEYTTKDIEGFPLGVQEDYVLNRRQREVQEKITRFVEGLETIHWELEAEQHEKKSSPENNEPELEL